MRRPPATTRVMGQKGISVVGATSPLALMASAYKYSRQAERNRNPATKRRTTVTVVRLLVAGFLFLSAWRLYLYALAIRASGEVAPTTEIPFWPITLVVAGGLLIYAVVELAKVFHLIAWGEWSAGSGPMVLGSDYLPQNQEQEGEVR